VTDGPIGIGPEPVGRRGRGRSPALASAAAMLASISGGTYEDLLWLKTFDANGAETATPIGRNPNFHNTVARYAPTNVRLGVRLTF